MGTSPSPQDEGTDTVLRDAACRQRAETAPSRKGKRENAARGQVGPRGEGASGRDPRGGVGVALYHGNVAKRTRHCQELPSWCGSRFGFTTAEILKVWRKDGVKHGPLSRQGGQSQCFHYTPSRDLSFSLILSQCRPLHEPMVPKDRSQYFQTMTQNNASVKKPSHSKCKRDLWIFNKQNTERPLTVFGISCCR